MNNTASTSEIGYKVAFRSRETGRPEVGSLPILTILTDHHYQPLVLRVERADVALDALREQGWEVSVSTRGLKVGGVHYKMAEIGRQFCRS